jgi:hypothetical protein
MSDDEAVTVGSQPAGDWSIHDAASPAESVKSDAETDDKAGDAESAPSQPIQKRRRVTRACDECRRKKIKCDGKQPCTHCSVYSYGAYQDGVSRPFFLLFFLPLPTSVVRSRVDLHNLFLTPSSCHATLHPINHLGTPSC